MNGRLQEILARKADEIASGRAARPLARLRDEVASMPPCRDFRGALAGDGVRIIAEVKRRSPSRGPFRRQEPPAELAALYDRAGAAALSLVVDRDGFGTGPEDIEPMRAATSLPLLAKEFVLDPWQVLKLRAAGADAVLLIARILGEDRLVTLHAVAREAGLAVLVECHDEADLARARAADAELVGINNRDLDTFTVSLATSHALLPLVPAGCMTVVESGIHGHDDVVALRARGAQAFLVGESLLQADDPARVLRALRGAAPAAPPEVR